MTKKTLNVVFIILGIIAFFCTYQFYYTANNATIDEINQKNATLRVRIDELDTLLANEATYDKGIAEFGGEIKDNSSKFMQDFRDDDVIMYACNMEDEIEDLFIGDIIPGDASPVLELAGGGYELTANAYAATYTLYTKYDHLKEIISFVNKDGDTKRNITELMLEYNNETGELTGILSFDTFTVTNYGKEYKPIAIPTIEHKTDCLFGEIEEKKKED